MNEIIMPHNTRIAHPEYQEKFKLWKKIRHCLSDEDTVKSYGKEYLPEICVGKDQSGAKYQQYLDRAVFVPFAKHVVEGFVGTLFRRPVQVSGNFDYDVNKISKFPFQVFARRIAENLFSMGRIGVYTDYSKSKKRAVSHIVPAESIISWEEDDDGELTYLLMQQNISKPTRINDASTGLAPDRRIQYKALYLRNGKYVVEVYDQSLVRKSLDTPLNKGKPLDYIPFQFFGPQDNTSSIDDSPILALVNLNFSHYRTSGLLETGRHFTSFPVYVVPVDENSDETEEYVITPSVVWEVPLGSKPFVLEFYGQGLNHLADALIEKERQLVQMGARTVGIRDIGTKYESPEIFALLYQAELARLINITDTLSEGLRKVIETNFELTPEVGGNKEKWEVVAQVSQEFKTSNLISRDLRAITLLHENHLLPLPEVFRVLQAAEYLSSDITFDEFRLLVDSEKKEAEKDQEEELQMKTDIETDAATEIIEEEKKAEIDKVKKTADVTMKIAEQTAKASAASNPNSDKDEKKPAVGNKNQANNVKTRSEKKREKK